MGTRAYSAALRGLLDQSNRQYSIQPCSARSLTRGAQRGTDFCHSKA